MKQGILGVAAACLLAGVLSGATAITSTEDMSEPTQAQSVLPREDLTIVSGSGKHIFSVELARTPRQQQVGEMFRTQLAPNNGMLFLWSAPQQSDMWLSLIPI